MKILKKTFVLLLTILFLVLSQSNIKFWVSAKTQITRTDKINIYVSSKTSPAVTRVERTVSFVGPYNIVLPKENNVEVFSICSPLGGIDDFASLKNSIRVKSVYGANLQFDVKKQNSCVFVTVPYYKDVYNGDSLKFVLTYKAAFYVKYAGGLLEVLYPGFAKDTEFHSISNSNNSEKIYRADIIFHINKKLGPIADTVPKKKITVQGSEYSIAYKEGDLLGHHIRVLVGQHRQVHFILKATARKTNFTTPNFLQEYVNNEVRVYLPLDDSIYNQKVLFSKVSPLPKKIEQDEDGNVIAVFDVSATKDVPIYIEGYATISKNKKFNKEALKKEKISALNSQMQKYISGTRTWDIDNPVIKTKASALLSKDKNIYKTLVNDLNFVIKNLTYDENIKISTLQRKGAVKALEDGKGVCMEYSDLLIALLRAQGIPARTVFGNTLGLLTDNKFQELGHQWVEVYFNDLGWVPVDPTWSSPGDLLIGPDLDHFVHYKAGTLEQFNTLICSTFDITQSGEVCSDYSFSVKEAKVIPTNVNLMTLQDLSESVTKNISDKPIVDKYLTYISRKSIGRVLFSVPGIFMLSIIALVLFIFFTKLLWKILKYMFQSM